MIIKECMATIRFFSTKTTVCPKQIKIFNQFANECRNENGKFKLLHFMNPLRVSWMQNRLLEIGTIPASADKSRAFAGLSILDVGCAGGLLSEPLSRLGGNVTGLDCNAEMIEAANFYKPNELSNLQYVLSTIETHSIDNREKYDVIVSSETIEHVLEKDLFVKSCVECLKPGGSFFVTTNSKSLTSKFLFITLLEDILRHLPKGTHKYDMFVDVEDLKKMLKRENCETLFTSGMIYNPIKHKWVWIENHYISHYVLHAVKRI